jgi:peptidyl-prolyl cis-trans isomerase SurA
VIAGTGFNATDKTVEATRFAKKAGADGALIVTPYYNRPTPEGIYQHFAAVAKAVSEDPQSAVEGGDLGWAGPGNFVPIFEEQLNKLQPNEISPPFRTQFGWHIVQVLERRVYDATVDKQKQEAILAIRNSKLGDEVDIWTRRLRDEAFVEYRL